MMENMQVLREALLDMGLEFDATQAEIEKLKLSEQRVRQDMEQVDEKINFIKYLLFQKHSFRNGTLWARTLWTATLAAAWTLREYFLFKKNAIKVDTSMYTNKERNIHGSLLFFCLSLQISSPPFFW